MARKSRKITAEQIESTNQVSEITYKTAIYVRLSKEDFRDVTDCSIETQIELVKQYIEQNPYLQLCEIFADNGATGTNFDRPNFIRMMEEVKAGNINCIVVKDLSRFGRNYIEVGNYIEKIFPFMGIRFISINDNFDTFDPNFDNEALTVALKSLIHDIYAKDLSVKIKSALDIKRKNGEFIGNYPPFGYSRSEYDKSKFIVDEEVAPIIRNIFKWKIEGMIYTEIARKLNEMNIPSPGNYQYSRDYLKSKKFSKKIYWEDYNVKIILTNQVYIGSMVQGKGKLNIQSSKRNVVQKDNAWFVVTNTHEPIIDKDIFEKVQELVLETRIKTLKNKGKYDNYAKTENILKGILVCGTCGKKVNRYGYTTKGKKIKYRYYCKYCNKYHKDINPISFMETKLFDIIQETIANEIKNFVNFQNIIMKMKKSNATKLKVENISKNIFLTKQRITKKETMLKTIYEDYSTKLLTKEEYFYAKERYLSEHIALQQELNELVAEKSTFDDKFIDKNKFVQEINSFKDDFHLNATILEKLVDKIIINNDKSVEIQYKFKDEYANLINFAIDNGVKVHE